MNKISDIKRGEKFRIETIQHIADMTQEQFDCFHADLRNWFGIVKKAQEINEITGVDAVLVDDSRIEWVFDDKENCDMTVQVLNEDGS